MPARLVLRFALTSAFAKKPVRSAPSVPPTPWTPNVSSASSYLKHRLELGAGEERHHAGEHADEDRAGRRHEARRRA